MSDIMAEQSARVSSDNGLSERISQIERGGNAFPWRVERRHISVNETFRPSSGEEYVVEPISSDFQRRLYIISMEAFNVSFSLLSSITPSSSGDAAVHFNLNGVSHAVVFWSFDSWVEQTPRVVTQHYPQLTAHLSKSIESFNRSYNQHALSFQPRLGGVYNNGGGAPHLIRVAFEADVTIKYCPE